MAERILFYARRNLHLPHMEPIRQWMNDSTNAEVIVASPEYVPSREGRPGIGLDEAHVRYLAKKNVPLIRDSEVAAWKPDVTVMADADFGSITWGGKIANVNHGLISKGFYYTASPHVHRENTAHLICVPGSYHAEVLKKVLHTTVIATGFAKFDPIGKGELTKESARKRYGIPVENDVVLFAPTFNLELSGVPVIRERIREIAQKENRWVLIKLHGMAPSIWTEMYELIARLDERVIYVTDDDITPSMVAADVVISDVSSTMMEAIALDRPVVLVDNPLQQSYFNYDASNIEYAWRDAGLRAATADEVLEAVNRSFEDPDEKRGLRREYGPRLVGPIDGNAAQRAGEAILAL